MMTKSNRVVYLRTHDVFYAPKTMKMNTQTIPWTAISAYMEPRGRAAELAEALQVGKQAVTNWKTRGGIPIGYAPALARFARISLEDLLKVSGLDNSSNRTQERPLSDVTRRLISYAIRLDRAGGEGEKILMHHAALLAFAQNSVTSEDGVYELNADEMVRLLQAPTEGAKEANER